MHSALVAATSYAQCHSRPSHPNLSRLHYRLLLLLLFLGFRLINNVLWTIFFPLQSITLNLINLSTEFFSWKIFFAKILKIQSYWLNRNLLFMSIMRQLKIVHEFIFILSYNISFTVIWIPPLCSSI